MKRRSFIKLSGTAGLFTVITPSGFTQSLTTGTVTALEDGFRQPPSSAQPHTWWHWMNGHVTEDGITRDLEAMKNAGVGGFQNFFVGTGIPKGPVEYLSNEWLTLMKHTIAEAGRLGLEFQLHNCPGWSSTGGPWITPELSMQQVTWSELFVTGGQTINTLLPAPPRRMDYYKDSMVIAFPTTGAEGKLWYENLTDITLNNKRISKDELLHITGNGLEIKPAGNTQPAVLLLSFSQPLSVQSVLIHANSYAESGGGGVSSVAPVTVEVSDDGTRFRSVADIKQIGGETPGTANFPETKATHFRVLFSKASLLHHISFSGAPRLTEWTLKGNYANSAVISKTTDEEYPKNAIIDPASVLDISKHMNASGQLNWNAPAGNWTIIRFGHTTTARINKAAPATGEGLEVDKFDPAAFDFHFNKMLGNLLPLLKPLSTRNKVGILIDSYEVGMQNWTPKFPAAFKQSRQYDITQYMPALTGRVVGSADITNRFLWDLRRVQSDLMADNYYGRCAQRCRENGFLAYTEPYNNGPFEQMQVGARMDVNMGEFWVRTLHFRHSLKLASSIQHINGKKVVGAESFTGYNLFSKWQEYPFSLKAAGDYMYTKGLNRIIFHRFAHQPHPDAVPGMTMGPWGMHFDRTNTWFKQGKAWLHYLARCQYMLQQGLFVADFVYYTGEDAPGIDISTHPITTCPAGYDYDFMNSEVLLKRVSVTNHQITLPDGMHYRVMVLPAVYSMSVAVLKKIQQLVNDGMYIIGDKPGHVTGLGHYPSSEEEALGLIDSVWGGADANGKVVGKGKVFTGITEKEIIVKLAIGQDFVSSSKSPDAAINYIHKRIGDTDIYFVTNQKRRSEELVCSFRVTGKQPEYWNADTGETTPVVFYRESNGHTQLPVQLDPAGSVFIVFRPRAATVKRKASLLKDGREIIVTELEKKFAGRNARHINNFTMTAWIKPDCDIGLPGDAPTTNLFQRFGPRSFVFCPAPGDKLYGEGHVTAGLVAGRNGVAVFERTVAGYKPVLMQTVPISGWTHIALVYADGVPSVYINGKSIGKGEASVNKVHPCYEEEFQDETAPYFEGDMTKASFLPNAPGEVDIQTLADTVITRIELLPAVSIARKNKSALVCWTNGNYELKDDAGKSTAFTISDITEPIDITNDWKVAFPAGTGAPAAINLPKLISLHHHTEDGVKYFSGTASYTRTFRLKEGMVNATKRIYLDAGRVEVMAEIFVNGKSLGILWKPPFILDISGALKPGENKLELQVTNLWANRLIGDEQLPPENDYNANAFNQSGGIKTMPDWYVQGKPKPAGGRVTFSTWRHYNKDSPLLESGLVGPVLLRMAIVKEI